MKTVTIRLKGVTPLFIGGADPNDHVELRVPSIKGVLRFWYRAVDPAYRRPVKEGGATSEEILFGSAGSGAGFFRLILEPPLVGTQEWNRQKYERAQNKGKPDVKKGALYLGYSHDLGKGKPEGNRKAVAAGADVVLTMRFRVPPPKSARRALAAAWWLLGHVGGIGSRSRRGFGTLAIRNWQVENGEWPELSELPIAHGRQTPMEWLEAFKKGLSSLNGWFGSGQVSDHLVLGPNTRFYLINSGHGRKDNMEPWEEALNAGGRLLQDFRQRYGAGRGGDYDRVKRHLGHLHPKAPCSLPGALLSTVPERAAFGLPLTFRFSSMKYKTIGRDGKEKETTPNITFQGVEHDRNASPVHLRIIQIGPMCYPFFARFDAPLLRPGEQIAVGKTGSLPNPFGASAPILDAFCGKLAAASFGEVAW